ncbi:MAG: hypothetical protein GOV15_02610 [Candidatus Diapherotrites archaeon]|nr:hypothetical protein [Candidatus Diapherotrites archaeon]
MVKRFARKLKDKFKHKESKEDIEADEDRLIFYGLLVALAVTIVFAGYAVWVAQQPTPFSQTWLEETSLPSEFTFGTAFSFDFVIDSHEVLPGRYNYVIAVNEVVKDSGFVVLNPGEQQAITSTILLNDSSVLNADGSARVIVTISKTLSSGDSVQKEDYSLWFWIKQGDS